MGLRGGKLLAILSGPLGCPRKNFKARYSLGTVYKGLYDSMAAYLPLPTNTIHPCEPFFRKRHLSSTKVKVKSL